MHLPEAIKQHVISLVREYVDKASKHFGKTYPIPEVRFDCRGRRGGYAAQGALVNFNPILLMENQQEYFTQVVPHEVAHCIDWINQYDVGVFKLREGRLMFGRGQRKRSIHGPTWQAVMRVFGCKPDRCHQMDTTNAAVRVKTKYQYQCTGCQKTYLVSSVRHNRQQQHKVANPEASLYTCHKCGRIKGTLVFIANHGQVSFRAAREAALSKEATTKEVPVQQLLPQTDPGVSNAERARRIFEYGGPWTRQTFIARAVASGIKATTASTYYANLTRT